MSGIFTFAERYWMPLLSALYVHVLCKSVLNWIKKWDLTFFKNLSPGSSSSPSQEEYSLGLIRMFTLESSTNVWRPSIFCVNTWDGFVRWLAENCDSEALVFFVQISFNINKINIIFQISIFSKDFIPTKLPRMKILFRLRV
jgi:hypothetical protein